jgi:hypothetical protein
MMALLKIVIISRYDFLRSSYLYCSLLSQKHSALTMPRRLAASTAQKCAQVDPLDASKQLAKKKQRALRPAEQLCWSLRNKNPNIDI